MEIPVAQNLEKNQLFYHLCSSLKISNPKIIFPSKLTNNKHLAALFQNLSHPIHKLEQVGASTLNTMTHRNVESSFDITICAFKD